MNGAAFEISATTDESSFVLLVCPDSYTGFIGEDWTLEEVLSLFVEQMNAGSLFAVFPGADMADLPLRIATQPLPHPCLREVSGLVQVGAAGLWLTDYPTLAMAAQFVDEPPIQTWHRRLPVGAGLHRIVFRQFARSWEDDKNPTVELIILPSADESPDVHHDNLSWFE